MLPRKSHLKEGVHFNLPEHCCGVAGREDGDGGTEGLVDDRELERIGGELDVGCGGRGCDTARVATT